MRLIDELGWKIEYIEIVFNIIRMTLIIPIFICFKGIVETMIKKSVLRKGVQSVQLKLEKMSKDRTENNEQLRLLYGDVKATGFLNKIEVDLRYAGIVKGKISFEVVVLAMTSIVTMSVVLSWVTLKNTYITLVSPFVVIIAMKIIIDNKIGIRYKKTDAELLSLLAATSNYCLVTDNLVSILERAACNLNGVLRKEILVAVDVIRAKGETSIVLKELEINNPHPFFKTFIRNLEIASRNKANYIDVVNECKSMLDITRENEKKIAQSKQDARGMIMILSFIGIAGVYMIATEMLMIPISELLKYLTSDLIGTIVTVYTTVVVIVGIAFSTCDRGGAKR